MLLSELFQCSLLYCMLATNTSWFVVCHESHRTSAQEYYDIGFRMV